MKKLPYIVLIDADFENSREVAEEINNKDFKSVADLKAKLEERIGGDYDRVTIQRLDSFVRRLNGGFDVFANTWTAYVFIDN